MKQPFVFCLLCLAPVPLLAQSADADSDLVVSQNSRRWTLGAGLALSHSGYAGEGTRLRPFPLLIYEGERLFWQGLSGGVHAFKSEHFGMDVVVSGRFYGFDADDLDRRKLAENGIDGARLRNRHDELAAGLALKWRGRAGELRIAALNDVTGSSGGLEVSADYAYAFQWGGARVAPTVGVRWMSRKLSDYYYGTWDAEVAQGLPAYRPGGALVSRVGIAVSRPLGEKWLVFGEAHYNFLPGRLTDSPLMDRNTHGSAALRIGIGRSF